MLSPESFPSKCLNGPAIVFNAMMCFASFSLNYIFCRYSLPKNIIQKLSWLSDLQVENSCTSFSWVIENVCVFFFDRKLNTYTFTPRGSISLSPKSTHVRGARKSNNHVSISSIYIYMRTYHSARNTPQTSFNSHLWRTYLSVTLVIVIHIFALLCTRCLCNINWLASERGPLSRRFLLCKSCRFAVITHLIRVINTVYGFLLRSRVSYK